MKKRALKALGGSIKKWKAIADGTGLDFGNENCPLCHEFYDGANTFVDNCLDCPIFKKTGQPYCRGTPYSNFCKCVDADQYAETKEQKKAARAMLDFLIDLLPEAECS